MGPTAIVTAQTDLNVVNIQIQATYNYNTLTWCAHDSKLWINDPPPPPPPYISNKPQNIPGHNYNLFSNSNKISVHVLFYKLYTKQIFKSNTNDNKFKLDHHINALENKRRCLVLSFE